VGTSSVIPDIADAVPSTGGCAGDHRQPLIFGDWFAI
jgi:hypothetical protein